MPVYTLSDAISTLAGVLLLGAFAVVGWMDSRRYYREDHGKPTRDKDGLLPAHSRVAQQFALAAAIGAVISLFTGLYILSKVL